MTTWEPVTEAPAVSDPRRISNTEVGTWETCKRKYYFSFDLKLEKIQRSEPLTRGLIVHEVLDVYYTMIKEGHSTTDAKHIALQRLSAIMTKPESDMSLCLEIKALLERYWANVDDSDWEIIAVEQDYDLPMTDEFIMPMRLDLLVKQRSTGKVFIVDHKVVYDFWNYHQTALNPQFAKYVAALRYNGMKIDGCILNFIRYRKMKDQDPAKYFKRDVVVPSNAKIRNTVREHVISCQEIMEYRAKPAATREAIAVHCLNTMICKGCDFKDLCAAEIDGGETEFLLQNEFRENTYDYNKVDTTEGLM